jgi:hypothetical protein
VWRIASTWGDRRYSGRAKGPWGPLLHFLTLPAIPAPRRRFPVCLPPIPDVARSWFAVEPILRKGDTPLQWLFRADRPLRVVFAGQMGALLIEDLVGLSATAVSEIRQHPRKRVVAFIAGRG